MDRGMQDRLNCSLMSQGFSEATYHPQTPTGGALPCLIHGGLSLRINTVIIYINIGCGAVNLV